MAAVKSFIWPFLLKILTKMNWSPAGLLTLMQVDPQHFEFLDEGFGHSRVLQRTGAVRERLLAVTRFLRSYLPGFEYGIDLTRGGPLENVEERVGYFRITRSLTLPFPRVRRGLGPNWGGWDDWDSLWLPVRLLGG